MNKFKFFFSTILNKYSYFIFIILIGFYSCEITKNNDKITSLKSLESYDVEYLSSSIIIAGFQPADIENLKIEDILAKSSDENIFTAKIVYVNKGQISILINTKNMGTAILTITIKNSDKKTSSNINVKTPKNSNTLSSINIHKKNVELFVNQNYVLNTNVFPKYVLDTSIIWTSTDENVATVSTKGEILAKNIGKVYIIATSNSKKSLKDTCILIVKEAEIKIAGINLDKKTLNLFGGETSTLKLEFNPPNTTNKGVIWSSSNSSIASVLNGVVQGGNIPGDAKIYVISVSNPEIKDSCLVTVKINAKSIILNKKVLYLYNNEKETLKVEILPSNAFDKNVIWLSSVPDIASVNDGIVLGGNFPGETKIYSYLTSNPKIIDSCIVHINVKTTSLSLNKKTMSLIQNQNEALSVEFNPVFSTDKSITWSTSDPLMATVVNGVVTASNNNGIVKIYAILNSNPLIKDSCIVTIRIIANKISLNKKSLSLNRNGSEILTVDVIPTNAIDKTVSWYSESSLVSVTNGLIRAGNNDGEAKIFVILNSNPLIKDSCRVFVGDVATSLTLNKKALSLSQGQKETLTVDLQPPTTFDKLILWSSSSPDIASVTNGEVTAGSISGETKIYAISNSNPLLKDSCTVNVSIRVTSLSLNKKTLTLNKNGSETLTVNIEPLNATDKTITWSSESSLVTVTNGLVLAGNVDGVVKVYAISNSNPNIKDSCIVTIKDIATSLTLNKNILNLTQGAKETLSVNINPPSTTDKTVTWISNNVSVASVLNGEVTAGNVEGITKIYAISNSNPNLKDSCTVNVIIKATSLTLNKYTLDLVKGKSETLIATLLPSNTSNKTINWSSSDNGIVSVTSDGIVTANKVGSVDITVASVSNPSLTKICKVTVDIPVTSVKLNFDTLLLNIGEYETLIATILPTDAIDHSIIWSSNDNSNKISIVNGKVTALDTGIMDVYVTTTNGFKDTCKIIIYPNPELLTFNFEKLNNSELTSDISLVKNLNNIFTGDVTYFGNLKLIPTFTLTNGATAEVKSEIQTSGLSVQDFTNSIQYDIISANKKITTSYTVEINFINDTFEVDANGVLTCKITYLYSLKVANIPSIINGIKVIKIADNAFKNTNLISLNLPITLEEIGNSAFEGCSNLSGALNIPDNVNKIGNRSFYNCSTLVSLKLSNSLTNIGDYAFFYCYGFKGELNIPNSVISIGISAFFRNIGFTSLKMSNSIEIIKSSAFIHCFNLKGSLNLPSSLLKIEASAFFNCYGFDGNLTFGNSLTRIEKNAFKNCSTFVGNLVLPNSLTFIGNSAFENCSGFNGSLTLSNSLDSIGTSAFSNCSGFTGNLVIPNSVTFIGGSGFSDCNGFKGTLTLSNRLTVINGYTFASSNNIGFTGVLYIPSSIKLIEIFAFSGATNFTEIQISSDTQLGYEPFFPNFVPITYY